MLDNNKQRRLSPLPPLCYLHGQWTKKKKAISLPTDDTAPYLRPLSHLVCICVCVCVCPPPPLLSVRVRHHCVNSLPRINSFAPRSFCKRSLSARRVLSIASLTALALLCSVRLTGGAELALLLPLLVAPPLPLLLPACDPAVEPVLVPPIGNVPEPPVPDVCSMFFSWSE